MKGSRRVPMMTMDATANSVWSGHPPSVPRAAQRLREATGRAASRIAEGLRTAGFSIINEIGPLIGTNPPPLSELRRAGLPLTCDMSFVYVLTWLIAALLLVSSVAGLLYGRRGLYDPDAATLRALLGQDAIALIFGLPLLLGSAWLARRGSMRALPCWMERSSTSRTSGTSNRFFGVVIFPVQVRRAPHERPSPPATR